MKILKADGALLWRHGTTWDKCDNIMRDDIRRHVAKLIQRHPDESASIKKQFYDQSGTKLVTPSPPKETLGIDIAGITERLQAYYARRAMTKLQNADQAKADNDGEGLHSSVDVYLKCIESIQRLKSAQKVLESV